MPLASSIGPFGHLFWPLSVYHVCGAGKADGLNLGFGIASERKIQFMLRPLSVLQVLQLKPVGPDFKTRSSRSLKEVYKGSAPVFLVRFYDASEPCPGTW